MTALLPTIYYDLRKSRKERKGNFMTKTIKEAWTDGLRREFELKANFWDHGAGNQLGYLLKKLKVNSALPLGSETLEAPSWTPVFCKSSEKAFGDHSSEDMGTSAVICGLLFGPSSNTYHTVRVTKCSPVPLVLKELPETNEHVVPHLGDVLLISSTFAPRRPESDRNLSDDKNVPAPGHNGFAGFWLLCRSFNCGRGR
uniref:Calpain catalytic domain-containing protein n=1 Tax=Steinernema glaseri TaxID=37863 RepID=A0A1I7Z424_9BILA